MGAERKRKPKSVLVLEQGSEYRKRGGTEDGNQRKKSLSAGKKKETNEDK